jgi:hypothetical protein
MTMLAALLPRTFLALRRHVLDHLGDRFSQRVVLELAKGLQQPQRIRSGEQRGWAGVGLAGAGLLHAIEQRRDRHVKNRRDPEQPATSDPIFGLAET